MRTFVLRILVDETDPEALRGVLRSIADGEERPFESQQNFLELLRAACSEDKSAATKQKSN